MHHYCRFRQSQVVIKDQLQYFPLTPCNIARAVETPSEALTDRETYTRSVLAISAVVSSNLISLRLRRIPSFRLSAAVLRMTENNQVLKETFHQNEPFLQNF